MKLGENLANARRKAGLTQEQVAEKLGVSRQTVSKWELDETLPDIRQAKSLSALYHLTLDELVGFDLEQKEIEEAIARVRPETEKKIDWTAMWGQRYPVLLSYPDTVDQAPYREGLTALLRKLQSDYRYGEEDAFLVLKDILGKIWAEKQA